MVFYQAFYAALCQSQDAAVHNCCQPYGQLEWPPRRLVPSCASGTTCCRGGGTHHTATTAISQQSLEEHAHLIEHGKIQAQKQFKSPKWWITSGTSSPLLSPARKSCSHITLLSKLFPLALAAVRSSLLQPLGFLFLEANATGLFCTLSGQHWPQFSSEGLCGA